ncbi:type IV pilin protein [Dyella acidisoli]|uniref:Pilus assembly protein PilE n=1 Tax=Dyella acidisoli TaxID=1867834 RepID=A0ABQ5XW06_9GAMM|nr:type IV pilin protein [Dyella acidisoli]GLQ95138.1 pilus assembly protein PilE [Dyella acidisoli]
MDHSRGFTLLELIVVVAIVAILAAIATQSYARYTIRSHRTDAHQMLMAVAQAQERWYATYNRYAEDLGKLGFADPAVSSRGYYHVVLSVADDAAQGFVATAMPIDRQASDVCGALSIDNAGRKLPSGTDVAANANGRCW